MSKRTQITDAILTACRAIAPGIEWGFEFSGTRRSNHVEGTVSCDEIEFKDLSKDIKHATAHYSIGIVAMDGSNDIDVDAVADEIVELFDGCNMSTLVYNVNVKRAVFGAVPGMAKSKVAKVDMDVVYQSN